MILVEYKDRFLKLQEAGKYFKEGNEYSFTMRETLDAYIDEHPCELTLEECMQLVEEAGNRELVEVCANTFFTTQENPKIRLVWMYGDRNLGKSSFVSYMEEIFATQEFNFKQSYCTMDEPKRGDDWAVQLYTSHEFDYKSAFTDTHFATLKAIFEGKGGQVSTNKFATFGRKMGNGFFLLASNDLPMCENINHQAYKSEWQPFMARCNLIKLEAQYVPQEHLAQLSPTNK